MNGGPPVECKHPAQFKQPAVGQLPGICWICEADAWKKEAKEAKEQGRREIVGKAISIVKEMVSVPLEHRKALVLKLREIPLPGFNQAAFPPGSMCQKCHQRTKAFFLNYCVVCAKEIGIDMAQGSDLIVAPPQEDKDSDYL